MVFDQGFRPNDAGCRQSVFDLDVAHRMPTDDHRPGFLYFFSTTTKDLAENLEIELVVGKANNVQRGRRSGAHRVDVAQRVRDGDLPEHK